MKKILFFCLLSIAAVAQKVASPPTLTYRQSNTNELNMIVSSAGQLLTPSSSMSITAEIRASDVGRIIGTVSMSTVSSQDGTIKGILPDLQPNIYYLGLFVDYANGQPDFRVGVARIEILPTGSLRSITDASGLNVQISETKQVLDIKLDATPSASVAAYYAQQARAATDTVVTAVANIHTYANSAANSASAASTSMQTALGYKNSAQVSADSALVRATRTLAAKASALLSEQNAKTSELAAQTSLTTVQGLANTVATNTTLVQANTNQVANNTSTVATNTTLVQELTNTVATNTTLVQGLANAVANNTLSVANNTTLVQGLANTVATNTTLAQGYANSAASSAATVNTAISSVTPVAGQVTSLTYIQGLLNNPVSTLSVKPASLGLIFVKNDSHTDGSGGTNYRKYLQGILRGAFGYSGPGYVPFNNGTATDNSISFSQSGLSYVSLNTGTPFSASALGGLGVYNPSSATVNASFSWTLQALWNTARVFYLKQPGGGSFNIRLTNQSAGSATTIPTSTTGANDIGYVDIAYAGTGNVGIAFDAIQPNTCLYGVLYSVTGKTTISLVNLAQGGRKLSQDASQDSTTMVKWYSLLQPSTEIIDTGTNDRITDNAATHYANLKKLVNRIQTGSPNTNVVLVQGIEPIDAATTNFLSYTQQKINLATEKGISYLDIRNALGGSYSAIRSTMMLDDIHENDKANRIKAITYAKFIGIPTGVNDPGITASPGAGVSTIIYKSTLSDKQATGTFTAGTPVTLWSIGLGQNYPTGIFTVRVQTQRATTTAVTLREIRFMLTNTTATNTVTSVGTITNTLLNQTVAGDSNPGDFTVSVSIVSGKAIISFTPTTYNTGFYYATGEYTINTSLTGQQVFEN